MRVLVWAVLMFTACLARAGQDIGLTLHSFAVPEEAAEETIPVKIEYSYEGQAGWLFVTVFAGAGPDWEIRSSGFAAENFLPGSHLTTTVMVRRPRELEATRTEVLAINVFRSGEPLVFRRIVAQPIEWKRVDSLPDYGTSVMLAAAEAFDVGDYAEIDRIVDYWTETSRFNKDGDPKLDDFSRTLGGRFASDRAGSLRRIEEWRARDPKSRAGALAEALYWVAYATRLRGDPWSSKAPDRDTMRIIRGCHAKAEKVLAASRSYAAGVPLWYDLRLRMAIDGARGEGQVYKAFNEAVRAFPTYQTFYLHMAAYLVQGEGQPRWRELLELADRLEAATRRENPGAYAALLDQVGNALSNSVPDLVSTGIASWPRLKASWTRLVDAYPSPYNLNRYAAMACQARDREAFQTAWREMRGRHLPMSWPVNLSADTCMHRFSEPDSDR